MELTIWIIIVVLFILSIVGVFVPIIPSVLAIWGGFLVYHFFLDSEQLTLVFWLIMAIFTIILIVADLLTNRYFVHKFGGSKASEWGAIIGVIIGAFIYPPLGLILVPFLFVFIIEIYKRRTAKEAALASIGALAGFLSGVVAKIIIQLIMIIWFFIVI